MFLVFLLLEGRRVIDSLFLLPAEIFHFIHNRMEKNQTQRSNKKKNKEHPIAGCFPDRAEKSDKEKTDKASAKSAQRTKVIDLERITGKRVPQIGIASIQGRNIDGLVSGKNRK